MAADGPGVILNQCRKVAMFPTVIRTTCRTGLAGLVAITCIAISSAPAYAQASAGNPVQKAGKYAVELRVPAEGLYAGEETDIEFRVTDATNEDPVLGAAPVANAKVSAEVSMPSMPSMPRQKPKTHAEGVPGDYGVVAFFPHGGEYLIDLTITPPAEKPFTVGFKVNVQDEGLKGRKPKAQPYTLEVASKPATPRVGEPAELTIQVRRRDNKQVVKDFDIVHEQKMHFIVVSKDLVRFSHEHPEVGADGKFTLRYTFPTAGEYRLFADTAPRGAGSQVLMQPIKVSGPEQAVAIDLKPVARPVESVDSVKIALASDARNFPVGKSAEVKFTLVDQNTGAPITDIQPWLGAVGHLILIHQDATTFVHSHPDESDPNNGKGQITFGARFPKAGMYRGWLQFQRGGRVHTAAFVVLAREAK
jgi:hypothetical protein